MTFPNPLNADDPLDAATLNPIFNAIYDAVSGDAGIYIATLYPDEFEVLAGNAIALTTHGSLNEIYGHQDTSAVNDEWSHGAYLNADIYTLRVRVIKSSASGILKIKVDDVVVATFDLYSVSDSAAWVQAGFSIATSQWHSIKGIVDSKNGSSSGYDANIVKMNWRGNSA